MIKTIRLLTLAAALGAHGGLLLGCATQTSDEPVAEAALTLSACGITDLQVHVTPERVEGDSSKCFVAMDTNKRARLTKDPNDLGLLEPRLISDAAGIRVYEGKGTAQGASLYGASMNVAGYTCSVHGLASAEEAVRSVEICSLVKGGAR